MAKQGQIQGVTFEEVVERGCGLEVHNTLRVLYIIASWGSTWLQIPTVKVLSEPEVQKVR